MWRGCHCRDFSVPDPPRGRPVGGGGVHRNRGYGGIGPHPGSSKFLCRNFIRTSLPILHLKFPKNFQHTSQLPPIPPPIRTAATGRQFFWRGVPWQYLSIEEHLPGGMRVRQEDRYLKYGSFWKTGVIFGVSLPAPSFGQPWSRANSHKNQTLGFWKQGLFGVFTSDQKISLIEPFYFYRRVFCMVP